MPNRPAGTPVGGAAERPKIESDFIAVRHFAPEVIRNLRAALDLGSTPAELKRLATRNHVEFGRGAIDHARWVCGAIDYMAANPTAGVVRWIGGQYTWADRKSSLMEPPHAPPA